MTHIDIYITMYKNKHNHIDTNEHLLSKKRRNNSGFLVLTFWFWFFLFSTNWQSSFSILSDLGICCNTKARYFSNTNRIQENTTLINFQKRNTVDRLAYKKFIQQLLLQWFLHRCYHYWSLLITKTGKKKTSKHLLTGLWLMSICTKTKQNLVYFNYNLLPRSLAKAAKKNEIFVWKQIFVVYLK